MKYNVMTIIVLAFLVLAACTAQGTASSPSQEPAGTEPAVIQEAPAKATEGVPATSHAFSVDILRNGTYSGIYEKPVTLTDGKYEGEPYVEGDASHPILEYIDGTELYGDLDGDGIEDAVVFLLERGGGSGVFTWVAAQLNRDGQPQDAGAVRIEDRIGVKSAAVEDGQVRMEIITQGPGDAACCGSHKANKTYALQDGRLVEIPDKNPSLEQVSAADLNGTSWTLSELNNGMPALPDVDVTLDFQDGQVNGSGGCNNYNGGFSLGSESPLLMTIGPLASTKMACAEPISTQETSYLTALESVTRWGYVFGKLALYYDAGTDEPGRLLFLPSAPAESLSAGELTAQPWQWVSFTSPVEKFEIESPENYTLTFNEDGTLSIKADCNMANASYTDDSGSLKIQVGPMTMAQCPPESHSDQFIKYLGSAARYFFQDGKLYIDLFADGGTLEFAPAAQ